MDVNVQAEWVGFGHEAELEGFDSGWHEHEEHQLLHASRGALRFEAGARSWLLPPGRGAWIPAKTPHRVTTTSASLRTVYVREDAADVEGVCVITMPPLAREMAVAAVEWGRERAGEPLARRYFGLMVELFVAHWQHERWAFSLPRASNEQVRRAVEWALEDLSGATLEGAAAVAYVSPRTLSRRFGADLGMTWRAFLRQARLMRAMEMLSDGEPVGRVAFEVGFESPSAFTQSFKELTGSVPSAFGADSSVGARS